MQSSPRTPTQIVAIGASAGGIDALRMIIGGLPDDFAPAIFVVLHTAADSPGVLAAILQRAGRLPAVCVRVRDPIRQGHIYVAAPDRHLLVEHNRAIATRGPKENRFRPAIDPLFRSAAHAYGPGVIGVILSGGLDDGSGGLLAIKQQGGTTIVQDPTTALNPSMPRSALRMVDVDHCLAVEQIAPLLLRLAAAQTPPSAMPSTTPGNFSLARRAAFPGEPHPELRVALEESRELLR